MSSAHNAITVTQTGARIVSATASAGVALPNANGGALARRYRVAGTAAAYFRLGVGAQTAVNTDMLLVPGIETILNRGAATHAAALRVTADGVVTITPLDD